MNQASAKPSSIRSWIAAGWMVVWGVFLVWVPILGEFRESESHLGFGPPPVMYHTSHSYGWPALFQYSPLGEPSVDFPPQSSVPALVLDLACLAAIATSAWIIAAVPASGMSITRLVVLGISILTAAACVLVAPRVSVRPDLLEGSFAWHHALMIALIISTTAIATVVGGILAERRFSLASLFVLVIAMAILLAVFLPGLREALGVEALSPLEAARDRSD